MPGVPEADVLVLVVLHRRVAAKSVANELEDHKEQVELHPELEHDRGRAVSRTEQFLKLAKKSSLFVCSERSKAKFFLSSVSRWRSVDLEPLDDASFIIHWLSR